MDVHQSDDKMSEGTTFMPFLVCLCVVYSNPESKSYFFSALHTFESATGFADSLFALVASASSFSRLHSAQPNPNSSPAGGCSLIITNGSNNLSRFLHLEKLPIPNGQSFGSVHGMTKLSLVASRCWFHWTISEIRGWL